MRLCDLCLKPIIYAFSDTSGQKLSIDVVPVLHGDVVILEDQGKTRARVTSSQDPEAMYKRHVCTSPS
jgi:isopentenyl phosphate kinase